MTLILTVTNPNLAVQVSDRRLTRRNMANRTAPEVWDPSANKTVIFRGADGLVSVSYTGSAYIQGQTTDNWIAEQLLGQPLGGRGFGSAPHDLAEIEVAMHRLAEAASRLGEGWHAERGQFIAGGFQWADGSDPQPVHWSVNYVAPDQRTYEAIQGMPLREDKSLLTAIPENTPINSALQQLGSATANAVTSDDLEQLLVDALRRTAAASEYIGSDCMVVAIAADGRVRARFVSDDPPLITVPGGPMSRDVDNVPASYSPWVIAPGTLSPPAVMVGTWLRGSPPWLAFEASGTEAPTRVFMGTQDRPPAPHRRPRW